MRWCLVFEGSLHKISLVSTGCSPGYIYSVMEEGFQFAISELLCDPLSQRVLFQTFSYENEFDFHENELTDGMQFHNNFFSRILILTQRQRATRVLRFLVRQKQPIHLILT